MEKVSTHVVVDMLYDFIDGSLACTNGEEAVKESIRYINAHPEQKVLYVCDSHPADHCSFKEEGGIWPVHCVSGTHGGAIHQDYYTKINHTANRPSKENMFYKGRIRNLEEYSGFNATDEAGNALSSACSLQLAVSGIATEYCIKETVLDLHRHGFQILLLKDALAYVDAQKHSDTLAELGSMVTVK